MFLDRVGQGRALFIYGRVGSGRGRHREANHNADINFRQYDEGAKGTEKTG